MVEPKNCVTAENQDWEVCHETNLTTKITVTISMNTIKCLNELQHQLYKSLV